MNLNAKEKKVIHALSGKSYRKGRHAKPKTTLSMAELASRCFPGVRPAEKAHSWVRNSLRRLVAEAVVQRTQGADRRTGLFSLVIGAAL